MAKFEMDTEFIRTLAKLLAETNLGEIEMADGDRRIRVARPAPAPAPLAAPVATVPLAVTAPTVTAPAANDISKHPRAVKSPMVGTAHPSPRPGKPEFVHIGDKVAAGQTLLIIYTMITLHPFKTPNAGSIE